MTRLGQRTSPPPSPAHLGATLLLSLVACEGAGPDERFAKEAAQTWCGLAAECGKLASKSDCVDQLQTALTCESEGGYDGFPQTECATALYRWTCEDLPQDLSIESDLVYELPLACHHLCR